MVVNHVCQVIRGKAVRLQHHVVVHKPVIEGYFAVYDVVEDSCAVKRHLEADDGRDPAALMLKTLLLTHIAASAVIAGRLVAPLLLLSHLCQTLCRAVAEIGLIALY